MYLRFVVTEIDGDSHQPQGLFIAAQPLLKSGDLSAEEYASMQEIMIWFNKNLPAPKKSWIRDRAIFWFRESAQECIRRMWQLVALFRAHGKLVEIQKCAFLANASIRMLSRSPLILTSATRSRLSNSDRRHTTFPCSTSA